MAPVMDPIHADWLGPLVWSAIQPPFGSLAVIAGTPPIVQCGSDTPGDDKATPELLTPVLKIGKPIAPIAFAGSMYVAALIVPAMPKKRVLWRRRIALCILEQATLCLNLHKYHAVA